MLEFVAGAVVFGGGVALGWVLRGKGAPQIQVKTKRPRWHPENLLDPITPEEQRMALRRES